MTKKRLKRMRSLISEARHLQEMWIEAGLWLHALETPPDRLYYLTPKEMTEFKLTTAAASPLGRKKG